MKAIGFNQGQYGDLCMCTVACRAFKRDFPDSILYLGINKRYESIKDIFLHNNYIDKIHIWDQYDGWPSEIDKLNIINEKFDKIFDPMPKHTTDLWYLQNHQTKELCLMHDLKPPEDIQVSLNKYFEVDRNKKTVAINMFAETRAEDKTPSIKKAKEIISLLKSLNYRPVQIGLPNQEQICEDRFIGTFIDTVKFVLSCDFLLTVDSAMSWIASGYSFPTIGLYSYTYYPMSYTARNWQPINPNAVYLEDKRIDEIEIDKVASAIRVL